MIASRHDSGGRAAHRKHQHCSTAINAGPTYRRTASIQILSGPSPLPGRMSSLDARPFQAAKQAGRVFVISNCPKPYAEFAHDRESSVRIKSSAVKA